MFPISHDAKEEEEKLLKFRRKELKLCLEFKLPTLLINNFIRKITKEIFIKA